jgi:hypothetical protein
MLSMGNKYRQPPSDLIRKTLEIQNRLGVLESTPRAANTSVDTGHWRFKASNGVVMLDLGDLGPNLGRGWIFQRGDNGVAAFALGVNVSSGRQFWRLVDNNLNDVITDDAQTGQGLARPYIPYLPVRGVDTVSSSLAMTTTSTSFVTAYEIHGVKQHPRINVLYLCNVPAGLTAEIQLVDTTSGTVLIAGPNTASTGFGLNNLIGNAVGQHLDNLNVTLQFRVASGAGTIGLTVLYALGVQS